MLAAWSGNRIEVAATHSTPSQFVGGKSVGGKSVGGKKDMYVIHRLRKVSSYLSVVVLIGLVAFDLHPVHAQTGPTATAAQQQFAKQLSGGRVVHSSPTFADVDGDGKEEIIIGTTGESGSGYGRPTILGAYHSTDGSTLWELSLIHISEPTRLGMISYAVFCLKKKK